MLWILWALFLCDNKAEIVIRSLSEESCRVLRVQIGKDAYNLSENVYLECYPSGETPRNFQESCYP